MAGVPFDCIGALKKTKTSKCFSVPVGSAGNPSLLLSCEGKQRRPVDSAAQWRSLGANSKFHGFRRLIDPFSRRRRRRWEHGSHFDGAFQASERLIPKGLAFFHRFKRIGESRARQSTLTQRKRRMQVKLIYSIFRIFALMRFIESLRLVAVIYASAKVAVIKARLFDFPY